MSRQVKVGDELAYRDVPLWGIVKLKNYPTSATHQKLPDGYILTCHKLQLPHEEERWVGEQKIRVGGANNNSPVIVLALLEGLVEYPPLLWEEDIEL